MRRDRRQARGRGGRYAHGGNCAMHRERYLARLRVLSVTKSPHVTEIEIHSRNSAKQT